MALPQPAIAIPREVRSGTLSISPKPSATIHFTSVQANHTDGTPQLVVFLNGLMTNKTSWLAAIAGLIQSRRSIGFPNMLAYDRYGQGLTEDHDPQDIGREEGHGHDVADTTNDLHHIILHVAEHGFSSPLRNYQLIFVANSIGCAIARLYAQFHPRTVAGLLLLDSMMANSNFDFWPNPDSENFREEDLQDDCSVEVLREQRAKYLAIFSPQATNKEGLSRRNLALLLPKSNEPRLIGSDGKGPWITVVGHDPETFAQESLKVRKSQTNVLL